MPFWGAVSQKYAGPTSALRSIREWDSELSRGWQDGTWINGCIEYCLTFPPRHGHGCLKGRDGFLVKMQKLLNRGIAHYPSTLIHNVIVQSDLDMAQILGCWIKIYLSCDKFCGSFSSPLFSLAQPSLRWRPGHCFSSGRPKPQSWGGSQCSSSNSLDHPNWVCDGFLGPIDGWEMLGLANPGIVFLRSGCQWSTLILLDHREQIAN